jgi:hypothetical protein
MHTHIGIQSIRPIKLVLNLVDLVLLSFNPLDDIAFAIADGEEQSDDSHHCRNH